MFSDCSYKTILLRNMCFELITYQTAFAEIFKHYFPCCLKDLWCSYIFTVNVCCHSFVAFKRGPVWVIRKRMILCIHCTLCVTLLYNHDYEVCITNLKIRFWRLIIKKNWRCSVNANKTTVQKSKWRKIESWKVTV